MNCWQALCACRHWCLLVPAGTGPTLNQHNSGLAVNQYMFHRAIRYTHRARLGTASPVPFRPVCATQRPAEADPSLLDSDSASLASCAPIDLIPSAPESWQRGAYIAYLHLYFCIIASPIRQRSGIVLACQSSGKLHPARTQPSSALPVVDTDWWFTQMATPGRLVRPQPALALPWPSYQLLRVCRFEWG